MMDGTTADITGLTVPEDDGAIAKAITQLDTKLSAWSSTMRDAQRQLKDRLEQASSAEVVGLSESHCESSAGTAVLDEQDAVSDEAVPESVAPMPEEPVSVLAADTAADEVEAGSVDCQSEEPVADVAVVEPPEETSTPPPLEEDEEALLATLAPEIVTKIRMMWRLSSTHKSIRELLKEFEKRTTEDRVEKSKKSSWFSRGK